ncbi:septation protein SepH [Nocardioides sp.]|uniref:septation protein SepH n=1 Tax=Nocardioides sp. TaxID=35761 RepID=UPI0039E3D290
MSAEELPDLTDAGAVSRPGDTSGRPDVPQQLTPVSLSRDGTRLTLVDADGNEFTVALDASLRPAGGGGGAPAKERPMSTPTLRPRDIQARIRAGESPEAVAEAAGTTVEKIMPFAGPVIGEREHMAERAQRASIRRAPGAAGTPRVLGDAVAARLDALELEHDAVTWDSWRRHDGRWSVVGQFSTPAWSGTAELTFDPPGNFVSLDNDDARWLVGDLADAESAESVRDDLAQARERRLSPAPALFEEEPLPLVDEPMEMFLEPTAEPDAEGQAEPEPDPVEPVVEEQPPVRRTVAKKRGRASVPSWDEIMFGGGSDDPA